MTPLRGEDDEIERVRDLDLEPPRPAPPGFVRRIERLDHDPLVALRERVLEKPLRLGRILGHGARHAKRSGKPTLERLEPVTRGPVDQILAVQMQAVEEERGQRHRLAQLRDVHPAPEPAHRLLEGTRPLVRPQGDRLSVQDDRLDLERADGLDDLGHAIGDVGEVPRERADFVAEPVHLQPRAVELPLDPGGADARQRALEVVARLREHRLDRAKHREPEARASPADPSASAAEATAPSSPATMTARRTSAAGNACDLRYRLDHDALERALPELAEEQARQEPLLALGRPAEEIGQRVAARGLRPGAGDRRDVRHRTRAPRAARASAMRPGAGGSRRAAQPTPIVPCGRNPER